MSPRNREQDAARVRAARAFADISQDDLAAAIGASVSTIARIEAARRDVADHERAAIADRCGVPRSFLEAGWGALAALERDHDELRTELITDFAGRLETLIASYPLGEAPPSGNGTPDPPPPAPVAGTRRRRRRAAPPS